jgi:hypothetical protein
VLYPEDGGRKFLHNIENYQITITLYKTVTLIIIYIYVYLFNYFYSNQHTLVNTWTYILVPSKQGSHCDIICNRTTTPITLIDLLYKETGCVT